MSVSDYATTSVKINLEINWVIVLIALIEAWRMGVPWYFGLAAGVLISVAMFFAAVPFIGAGIYYFLAKWLLDSLLGVWFKIAFYVGLAMSIVTTIVSTLVLVVWIADHL